MQGAMNAVMADGVLKATAKSQIGPSPATLLREINDVLVEQMEEGINITMVIGHIDSKAKTLQLANAGHHAHPLRLRHGTVTPLMSKGMPLGMMAAIQYRSFDFDLQSGDVVVFMTDGLIEAKNTDGQEYQQTDRLRRVMTGFTNTMEVSAMVDALIKDATTFGADMTAEEEDDITVVVVKVTS